MISDVEVGEGGVTGKVPSMGMARRSQLKRRPSTGATAGANPVN